MRKTTPAMIHILSSCSLLQEFLECELGHRELIMIASRMALQPNVVSEFQRFAKLHDQSKIASSIRARVRVGQFLHWVTPLYRGLFLEFCLQQIQQGAFKFELSAEPGQADVAPAKAKQTNCNAPTRKAPAANDEQAEDKAQLTEPPEVEQNTLSGTESITPEKEAPEEENQQEEGGLKSSIPLGLFHGLR